MRTTDVWKRVLKGSLLVLALMPAGNVPSMAQDSGPGFPFWPQSLTFGMVGLAVNQTAHLNVVNADPGSGPAVPCKLLLQFLDSEGAVVKQSWIENLQRGTAKYFELGREEVPDSPRRVQIRAVVRYASEPKTGAPMGPGTIIPIFLGCTVVPTLEVFNNDTGQTVVALGEARPIPAPMLVPLAAKAPDVRAKTAQVVGIRDKKNPVHQ